MSRLFVAVRPPAELCSALHALVRPEVPGVRWTLPAQWHVTLEFLGRAEPEAVLAALGAARLPACEAVAGPSVQLLGRNVIIVPVAGLDRLAGAVRAATEGLGDAPDGRPFRGHLTLGRIKGGRRGRHGARDSRSNDSRAGGSGAGALPIGAALSGRWRPRSVELVSSVTGPAGATHETVATFPVAGP